MPPSTSKPSLCSERQSRREIVAKLLGEMADALPSSTHAERQRFLSECKGDAGAATAKLKKYLEWREKHCNDDITDLDSWTYATQLALQSNAATPQSVEASGASVEVGLDGKVNADTETLKLPCTLFMQEYPSTTATADNASSDKGAALARKYLQLLPARIDPKLASTSVYALALAIYLDHVLDRSSTEKATLVIDVRSGHGWANIKAVNLLKFIQSTVRYLVDLFPCRLERCIVFPVPKVANLLWNGVHPFLGKETATKVCLVSGPAGRNDKVPTKLSQHLDKELIVQFEDRRKSCFVM